MTQQPHPTQERLEQYCAGLLNPEEHAAIERHLAQCEKCLADALLNDSVNGIIRQAIDKE